MSVPQWVERLLEQEHVRYTEHRHLTAFTAQEVARNEHVSGHRVAKVVVLVIDGQPVELIVPASRRVDLAQVRNSFLCHEVRLATEEEIRRWFQGCPPGAIPPLRHWPRIDLWMDDSLAHLGEIVFAAGTHEDAVQMRFRDWYRIAQPHSGQFTFHLATRKATP